MTIIRRGGIRRGGIRRGGGPAALLGSMLGVVLGLGACQSILPGDGGSRLALREKPVVASSGQKLGPDGYPLLGAFPNSATTQIDTATVQTERGGLQAAASNHAATASTAAGDYQRQLAELRAIKDAQRRDVDAALAPVKTKVKVSVADPDAVLRAIESGQ